MGKTAIVVTGLPASGKTTVGRAIAGKLQFPFLDKDDFLEQLFNEEGIGDAQWRARLSALSNDLFQRAAEQLEEVVLVSHWRPINADSTSGTSTQWISGRFKTVVELYCQCSVDIAVQRFLTRKRHPGNLDGTRTPQDLQTWMEEFANRYPLNIGSVLGVDTESDVDTEGLVSQLKPYLAR